MKTAFAFALALPSLAVADSNSARGATVHHHNQKHAAGSSSPIHNVVKMLKDMAEKSKTDGEAEADSYSKYECYCKKTLAAKATEIEDLTNEIAALGNDIESLKALGSNLATKKIDLEADITKATRAKEEADAVRKKANDEFKVEEADLSGALEQLNDALDTLGKAGGEKAALLQEKQEAALLAVSQKLKKVRSSFLAVKGPGSSSGGVLGVLESTRDTYVSNLEELRKTESVEAETHAKVSKQSEAKLTTLNTMVEETVTATADAKESQAEKETRLDEATEALAAARTFRGETDTTCTEKHKINEERKLLRAGEDAALAKAIAVLDNDAAFSTFTGASFLQTQAVGSESHLVQMRTSHPLQLLMQEARRIQSTRLAKAAMLEGPLSKVLAEIDKMQVRITEEAKADKKKFDWCGEERTAKKSVVEQKTSAIASLSESVNTLTTSLDAPEDGLQVTLKTAQTDLAENQDNQAATTSTRKAENVAYQKNANNLAACQGLIEKSMKVLKEYYDNLDGDVALLQVKHSVKDAPTHDAGDYAGQSEQGGAVIKLMTDILADTKAEEHAAHDAEAKAQADFEDGSQALADEEKTLRTLIADTEKSIAETELDLGNKKTELAETEKEKKSVEEYLLSIKSGCDFIEGNFDKREAARTAESTGLNKAVEALKASPAMKQSYSATETANR
eukprot:TRINITY_DN1135_c3_g1_i1.p1 TRINITY_DN1135_c3_g1~~TRINITY_DN1135_c3_g1_i1.p1  ORF type:complete len:682 (+),score=235.13 TRINITY_DN1135_c3_g1_i1:100-2145(+)